MKRGSQEKAALLRARIAQCRRYQDSIAKNVAKIMDAGLEPDAEAAKLKAYLGDKTAEEWEMLYTALIREAEDELSALERKKDSKERNDERKGILLAGAAVVGLLLLLTVFLFPMPIAVLTGNVIGGASATSFDTLIQEAWQMRGIFRITTTHGLFETPSMQEKLLTEETRSFTDSVRIRPVDTNESYTSQGPVPETAYDAELVPKSGVPVAITLHDVAPNQPIHIRYAEVATPAVIHNQESLVTYSLDPSAVDFSTGELTRTAKGRQLWKCVAWDTNASVCDGNWTMLRELVPGENYTVTFDRTDPGYAETNLIITDVQSYPIVGGLWSVRFTTIGTANLTIRASNGTIWSDGSDATQDDDLRFLTLTCGNQTVAYSWQDSTLHVENYTCDSTSVETSHVLTKGKHIIAFGFGNQTAYAKNYASAQGILMLRQAAGGQDVDPAYPAGANITWDTQERVDPAFSHQSGTSNVTVNTAGLYRISYGVSFTRGTANTRVEHYGRILVNGVEADGCYGQTYTRGSNGVTDSVATSDCILNLSSGDEVVLNAGRSSDTSLATTTIANRNWLHMQLIPQPHIALVRDSTGGQSVDNAAGNILDWDTADTMDSAFTFSPTSDNITINEDGLYRVTYGVGVSQATNTRYAVFGEMLLDGNVIPEGHTHTYIRGNTGARDGALTADMLLNLSAGDYLQVVAGRESTTSVTATTTPNRAWFQLEKIEPGDANVLMLRDAAGGQSVDTIIGANIDWDTVLRNDSDFSMSGTNTINVLHAGLYRVAYGVYTNRETTSNRFNTFGKLLVNGADYGACWSSGFMRGLQGGIGSYEALSFGSCLVNLSAADTLVVRVGRESTSSLTANVMSNSSWLSIQSLDRINEAPTVTNLTAPLDEGLVTALPTDFNFTAHDDQDDMTCTLYGNFSGTWGPNANVSNVQNDTETNITVSPGDGVYLWNVVCADQYGLNSTFTSNRTVTIDAHPPTMTDESFNVTLLNQSHGVRFNVTVTDAFAVTLVNATIRYPNATLKNVTLTQDTGNTWYFNFTDTNQTGLYNLTTLIARDEHNNTNTSQYDNLTFTVTSSPPSPFNLLAPVNDTVSTTLNPTLSWQQSWDEDFANYTIFISDDPGFGSLNYTYATQQVDNTTLQVGPLTTDTVWYWRVIAFDVFGSSTNSTQDYLYTTDTLDPTVNLNWPGNATYVTSATFQFNYTPVDTNLRNCTLWGDFNGSWTDNQTNTSVGSGQPNYFSIMLVDGNYSWNVECFDRAGLSGSKQYNYTVSVDTTPPHINLETPQDGGYENTTNNIVFAYNVTDAMAPIDNCILIIDGVQEGAPDITIQEGVTQNFTAFIANGPHNWSVNCTDSNSWTNSSVKRNITVNVTSESDPPVITPNSPDYAAFLQSNAVTFNYTPNDASGIENCTLVIDGSANRTNTTVSANQPNYFTVNGFSEALHTWRVDCYDNNTYAFGSSQTRNFTIDTTDPSVTLNLPGDGGFFTSVDVLFNYTPVDTNLRNCTLYGNFTGTFGPLTTNTTVTSGVPNTITYASGDGTYLWNVRCVDESLRSSFAPANYTVKVDANIPELANNTEEPVSPTTYAPSKLYRFNVTVTDAFLDTVLFENNFTGVLQNETVNATSPGLFSYNITALAAGSYVYRWYANDSVGHQNATDQYDYIVGKNTSQISLLLNGTDGNFSVVENSIVNLTALLINPSTGDVELYLDGEEINNGTAPLTNSTLFLDPGVYNVTALYPATQNYTVASETHFVIVNDTIAPDVSSISPAPNASVATAQVTFSYNVSDFSNIQNCSLYINGTFNKSDYSITKGVTQTLTQTFADGDYSWQVRCYDSWSNLGQSKTRNLTVSKTANIFVNVTTDKGSYENWEYAMITTNTSDKFGNPLATNITTSLILGNTTAPWWNGSWTYRKPLLLSQNESYNRTATVTLNLTGLNLTNCTKELRIVRNESANLTLEQSEVLASDDATWCQVRFNAFISADAVNETRYHAYYGNAVATDPGFTFSPVAVEVQRNLISSSSTSFTDSISNVDPSHAFLLFSYNTGTSAPNGGMISGTLISSQVQFSRYASASATVAWQVVAHPDIDVQRGNVDFTAGSSVTNVTLDTPITLNESFIIVSSRTDTATNGDHHDGWMTARFLNETTIQIERGTTTNKAHGEWQVVDWHGAHVQNLSQTLTAGGSPTADIAINQVDTGQSFIVTSRRTNSLASGINDQYVRANFTNSTNVHLSRNDNDGTMDVELFVVKLPGAYSQQNTTVQSAVTGTVGINPVNTSRAFSFASWESTGNGQTFTNSYEYNDLNDSTTLSIVKQTSSQTHTIDSFVVEVTPPGVSGDAGSEERLVAQNSSEATSGSMGWLWDTLNQPLGNYSAVSLAMRALFSNGTSTAFFTLGPDATAPNVTLLSPSDNSTNTSTQITFTYVPVDRHLQNCSLWHNGSGTFQAEKDDLFPVSDANNSFQETLSDGLYLWNVRCFDSLGNNAFASANMTLRIDTTGPRILLLSPSRDAYLNTSDVTFTYNATDPSGIDSCSLYIDGLWNMTNGSLTIGENNFSVTGLTEGLHTWSVGCEDTVANAANSSTLSFTLDMTPPTLFDLLSPPNRTVSANQTPTLSWQQPTEANFWNYTLQVSLSSAFLPALTTDYVSFTQNATSRQVLPLQMNQQYYWRVIASDKAGWARTSNSTFSYITDNESPVVLLLNPPDGGNEPSGNVTLTYEAKDNLLANCTLYTNLTGSWLSNATNTTVTAWQQASFSVNGLPTGVNFTFAWNVLCYDSLGNWGWAATNRTVRIGQFNETQGNQTIPSNATVNNTPPRTDSVLVEGPVDLIANGQQTVNCSANVSDDNGAADILGASAVLYHSSASAGSPDNASNHYTVASCGACTPFNSTSASCTCSFSLWYYADPGTWTCRVTPVDAVSNGTYGQGNVTVNQLQAVDVTPTLLDYGNVQGGTPSPEQNVSVINLGNVPINVTLWGYGAVPLDNYSMSCLNGANISVSSERFSVSSGTAYVAMSSLSGNPSSPSTATLALPKQTGSQNSTKPLYWRIQSGAWALGECNGTVVFQASII